MPPMSIVEANKTQLVTVIDIRNGDALGKAWRVRNPALWMRSDEQLRQSIKKAGSHKSGNNRDIRLKADEIGFENVGFKREWAK